MRERAFFRERKAELLTRFPAVTGIFIAITGILVLIGWSARSEVVVRVLCGMMATNPVTAVVFVLLGLALWLRSTREPAEDPLKRGLPYVLAAVVAAVGAIKLFQCCTGCAFHIDRLLFSSRLGGGGGLSPNAMAPNTALAFICSGVALLGMDFELRNGIRPAQVFALATGLIALLALMGHS